MAVYNWKPIYLDTFIPQTPKALNDNFKATENYIGVFFDASRGVIIAPVNTPGKIRGATVEAVTGIFDTLIVKKQFTNLYQNTTTIDLDFYNAYIGGDVSTRDPSTWENPDFRYVDLQTPYIKIDNDVSYGFKTVQLGQEFQILFEQNYTGGDSPFTVLFDPSINGGYQTMTVVPQDSSAVWIKLIAVGYDASWGTTWTVKQHGGSYTINQI